MDADGLFIDICGHSWHYLRLLFCIVSYNCIVVGVLLTSPCDACRYAMQSGAWTAIGFPVSDERARKKFYVYANWSYQAGVFVSRSSGTIWQAGYVALWVMPVVQCCMLAFFLADAVLHFWYNWSLMAPCFMTGLLGGAVYVNAFTLITKKVEPRLREFSLGAASVADGLGVAMADAVGILIQGCLFRANGLEGADFKCSL